MAGPRLTKFSQWAATRPDIFPQYLCQHLAQLQSNTQPHAWSASERVLSRAYGPQWRQLFGELDTEGSVGSGLVAQVYRGTLAANPAATTAAEHHGGGEMENMEVAVKVLHPDVKRALEDDLAMMRLMVQWLEGLLLWGEGGLAQLGVGQEPAEGGLAAVFSLAESVEEFEELMTAQLDLSREGAALTRFRQNFSGNQWADRVIFPAPIDAVSLAKDSGACVHNSDHSNSSSGSSNNSSNKSNASCGGGCRPTDVLVETFQQGIPMTEVLQRKGANASASSSLSLEQQLALEEEDKCYSWPRLTVREEKQVAALGMDIILKMVE